MFLGVLGNFGYDLSDISCLGLFGHRKHPSDAETAYNEGKSTQIPANAFVIIQSRFSRKISFKYLAKSFPVFSIIRRYPKIYGQVLNGMTLNYEKHT